ncbi:DEAD/DEAH box helicase [Neptuniibacter sp.]|uniref:DEAD/DEAH box helicase n=1 Tax=Neptuniibacter sp. TaxID=1962643 RepID=UPI00262C6301|nr:DEAD/DEAH box helicase [Neptuniibacter sp.]MCP4596990.1 DEAD/DEAH box helicase [Neptuniibacter sp.]
MSFTSLGLSEFLLKSLKDLGYEQPTPIQEKAIPAILEGDDILAAAETGSGKTAGFTLPILERLVKALPPQGNLVTALVLVPTRELAVQVEEAIRQYARFFPRKLKTLAVFGGVSINNQMQAMRGGCDIVVATPGRLLDLVDRNAVDLRAVTTLVLDEADRMLDLGFADELDEILDELPNQRQNLLFSATFPKGVKTLTEDLLDSPVEIEIKQESTIPEQLVQRAIEVDRNNRTMLLKYLLKQKQWSQILIFVASKRTANNVEMKLYRSGIQAQTLHGDLTQTERTQALKDFRTGRCKILIATDLAARGIDIPNLPCVLNYDLPRSPADYVHRIGRTARAGEIGQALSFVDHEGDAHFKLIEKRIQQQISREQIEGFERSKDIPESVTAKKGKAPVKGKRKSKKDKLREAAALKAQNDAQKQ